MKSFEKKNFEFTYLAKLAKSRVKPLSRWEGAFSGSEIEQ